MDKTEKQICLYSSALLALMLNVGKLLALRENGILAQYWHFNTTEFAYQVLAQFSFCYLMFYLNLKQHWLATLRNQNKYLVYAGINFLIAFFFMAFFGGIQRRVFHDDDSFRQIYWAAYTARFALAVLLTGILIKIILLMRASKQHQQENERLKNAYTVAELELLKEQLNPHFLFNSLSSLSGVVRENPLLAQQYIMHLSKVFRYTLEKPTGNLVRLTDELQIVASFAELLKMRLEEAFSLRIDIPEPYLHYRLPHLSLQPLLENAAKHNAATPAHPLKVVIEMSGDKLAISNNLQPVAAESSGIGLANLGERFRILMHQEIDIQKNTETFTVMLPLGHG
ncbi:sensor histidine kinase [Mucilaginibacter psychrotolerans]|uniref:Histidine kinase n=1 Tax=Mucilaginibacter psychrotolerans TaxID=1524096 RepID=A0A4Y8RXP2_9SPHI|nr:histidine kinase [Mucilaginibacter psychrotolerans]TFF30403.1 histidine kinase [Mucilaginibacter psychrotolerans]